MNRYTKKLVGKFFFTNAVIFCLVVFFCGSVTVSQRTAYNIYLKEYAVLSMVSEGEKVKMEGLSREISFSLPQKEELEKLGRYLKLTPLASTVFLFERTVDLCWEIFSIYIDTKAK